MPTNGDAMQISDETKELFKDPDFEKLLKTLATDFGGDASLAAIYEAYQMHRPVPEQVVNGKSYKAGYHTVAAGSYIGTLIDIRQHGAVCKLMFAVGDTESFLYYNYPLNKLKVEQVVRLAKYLNQRFPIHVISETIQSTGDRHSTIDMVKGLEEILGL
jgi:hypothetical protein